MNNLISRSVICYSLVWCKRYFTELRFPDPMGADCIMLASWKSVGPRERRNTKGGMARGS